MSSIIVAPSILAARLGDLLGEVRAVIDGGADWIHIDVMDGQFVPPITFGPPVVEAIRREFPKAYLDVHLMINNPERQITPFAKAGANNITVHFEATAHLHRLIQSIHAENVTAGVALNPATAVGAVADVLSDIELLLVMTVNPGWGGQEYIKHSDIKIKEAAELIKSTGKQIHLEVDGGIDNHMVKSAKDAGANVFVAGTYIFSNKNYAEAIKSLKNG